MKIVLIDGQTDSSVFFSFKKEKPKNLRKLIETGHFQFYSILGNNQFLYIDLVLTTLLALSLGRASPGPALTKQSPPVSLVAVSSILPLTLQVLLVLVMQILAVYMLQSQEWYVFDIFFVYSSIY